MHVSRLFFQRLKDRKQPGAGIFADLSKAFDKVLRAVVLGNTHDTIEELADDFRAFGIAEDVARYTADYVRDTGCVLRSAELHPAVLALLRDLHDGTWFQCPNGGGFITTRMGSRQGCKFGAIIFNLMYCRALAELRLVLQRAGVLTELAWEPTGPPWSHGDPEAAAPEECEQRYLLFYVAHVDGERIYITAGSNEELLNKLRVAVDAMHEVFRMHFWG